jgi:prophage regulatory protein
MDKFLRLADVCGLLGISRSTVYRLVNQGAFPAPILISLKAKGWLESEVRNYQKSRIAASRSQSLPA